MPSPPSTKPASAKPAQPQAVPARRLLSQTATAGAATAGAATAVTAAAAAAGVADDLPAKKKQRLLAQAAAIDANWRSVKAALPKSASSAVSTHTHKPASRRPSAAVSAAAPQLPTPPAAKGEVIALDCEMVGVGPSKKTALARVTLVDGADGSILLDTHVRPKEPVTDFRTRWSGILPHHLRGAPSQEQVVAQVQDLLHGKIVVGHGLKNDFDALGLPLPPRHLVRDSALYKPFRKVVPGSKAKPRKLKDLALEHLGLVIQQGRLGHDPVEDAKAALALYLKLKPKWDAFVLLKKA